MKILGIFFCLLACCLTVEAVTVFPASTNGNNVFTGQNSFTQTIHGNSTNVSSSMWITNTSQLVIVGSSSNSMNGTWYSNSTANFLPVYTNSAIGLYDDLAGVFGVPGAWAATNSGGLVELCVAPTAPVGPFDFLSTGWAYSDLGGIEPAMNSWYVSNNVANLLIQKVGVETRVGASFIHYGNGSGLTNVVDALNQVSNASLLHIGRTTFTNSVTTRLQTNSVIVTNGNIILPARYNIGDGGGGIFWHIPTNALVGTPTELTELGFCTVFRDWDGLGHNWLQFASENVRVEAGWGSNPGSGDVVLANELGVNQVWINYSQGTNTQGMMMGTPLFFPVNDNVHFMELPGISSVIVSNTVIQNTFGVSPGMLWFYSMAPMQWGDKRPGYVDDSIVTAKMHTNTWEFTYGVAIDSTAVASWPTNAQSANQVLLVVSNTTLFSLHTALNSKTWAATNKISGP